MRLRLLALAFAAALAGCAPDAAQVALCRSLMPALLPSGAAPEAVIAAADAGYRHGVRLDYRLADGGHAILCVFDTGPLGPGRLVLRAVAVDGKPLTPIQMSFLWRAYGLVPPADLVARAPAAPPVSAARRLAYFLQQLVNGLTLGAVLALIAAGYSLVYGITGTIQFAFGELFMIGAYLIAILLAAFGAAGLGAGAALAAAVPLAIAVTALHGWGAERLVYRPLRHAAGLAPLVAAIGLALALREYVRLVQGAEDKWLPPPLPARIALYDGDGFTVWLSHTQIFVVTLAAALAAALVLLRQRTAWGRAQRACADDAAMAALLGVDVGRTIASTFATGAALGAVAGLAVALYYGEADFTMGYLAGFKALTAALLGGFGSLGGAMLGGLLLGLFEAFWSGYVELAYKDAAIFAILILVLVFRPQGLTGGEGPRHRPP